MRKIRALTRERLYAKISDEDVVLENKPSIYHICLANKYKINPDFRHIALAGEEVYRPKTNAEFLEEKRLVKAEKDAKAGRKPQKESRLSVRAAYRRKVKTAKLAAKKAQEEKK